MEVVGVKNNNVYYEQVMWVDLEMIIVVYLFGFVGIECINFVFVRRIMYRF